MLFIDTEVNAKTKKIEDIGCINSKREEFHSNNINKLINFIRREDFFVGHNIINHDLIYLNQTPASKYIGYEPKPYALLVPPAGTSIKLYIYLIC